MLAVKGQPNADLAQTQPRGAKYRVEWVDIDDPDPTFPYTPGQPAPTTNNDAINYVGNQGRAKGAARFSRLEGAACATDVVYFTSTQGGGPAEPTDSDTVQGWGNGIGQVWAYWTRGQGARAHLRVARSRHPRLPRQRHGEQARHVGAVRGQHRRQLSSAASRGTASCSTSR